MPTPSPSEAVAANVRAEVARQRISQVFLAQQIGISQPGVSKRMRGKIPFTLDELTMLAKVLGVPLSTFLEGVEPAEASA